ncbi:hypothetical protein SteCoe_26760 [Stentor coeruleus]|uniref:Uncharacterized protein n=1 Tax=Stentor coeruleus TaxID=5963 RepID=A0A1R2BCG0_9CILI|nr:hypothetical protein SteCoe_26760 [Stentor coeruleus]
MFSSPDPKNPKRMLSLRLSNYESSPQPTRNKLLSNGSFLQNTLRISREPQPIVLPIEEEQILNVNCMNCQELISIDKIEEHSKLCTTVPEAVENIESGSLLNHVIFKLRKLETCLIDLTKNTDLRPGDKNYISIFSRLCQKTLNGNAEDTENVIKSLSSLLVTYKGSLGIRIYADRLHALVQEQKLGYQEEEINKKKEELEKIVEQVEKFKNRSQMLQKAVTKTVPSYKIAEVNRKVDEITSDLVSIGSGTSEVTALSGVDEEFKQELDEPFLGTGNDLQKHFYSLCLAIKMKNSGKNQMQNVSIQKLYKEAMDNNVPPDSWQEYINNQLKNPLKWIDDGRGRRRFQPRLSAMRPQYFEVIVEEDNSKSEYN